MKESGFALPKYITELNLIMDIGSLPKISITYYPTDEEACALFNTLNNGNSRWKVVSPRISTPRQPP